MSVSRGAGSSPAGKTPFPLFVLTALLQWHCCAASEVPLRTDPVPAIWARQELLFYYTGHRTLYTCGTIEDKVRAVLLDMGARDDVRIHANGCASTFLFESRAVQPSGRQPTPIINLPSAARGDVRVTIDIATPVELTRALLGVLQQSQGERDLVARIDGHPEAGAGIKTFPARWQQVELLRSSQVLDDSDCELIDEVIRQIYPRLGFRPIENAVRCAASQASSHGSNAKLMAIALVAIRGADASVTPLRSPQTDP